MGIVNKAEVDAGWDWRTSRKVSAIYPTIPAVSAESWKINLI